MEFQITHSEKTSKARRGLITTAHGTIETPVFMPVGTAGTVKGIHQADLENIINAPIILGNTYHLYLRPGTELLVSAGGLHKLMNWKRSLLTDSGGYQVYSLAENRKISEEGVKFKSHIDGSSHFFSPESAMEIQRKIGADIVMAFDECAPYPCEHEYARTSMHLTHRWLDRCIDWMRDNEPLYGYGQVLFPIVQGSIYEDLRRESARYIADKDCVGNAIGGLSVGEPAEIMYQICELVCEELPEEKPRYLMGVGTPANLLECIALGVDMFDCVMPTRNARNGMLFTTEGIVNIRNEKWKGCLDPIDPGLVNGISEIYSKAYIRHLFNSGEMLGPQLASLHNLSFYQYLMRESRERIEKGTFMEWKNEKVKLYSGRL